jgi:hypothetical protein
MPDARCPMPDALCPVWPVWPIVPHLSEKGYIYHS